MPLHRSSGGTASGTIFSSGASRTVLRRIGKRRHSPGWWLADDLARRIGSRRDQSRHGSGERRGGKRRNDRERGVADSDERCTAVGATVTTYGQMDVYGLALSTTDLGSQAEVALSSYKAPGVIVHSGGTLNGFTVGTSGVNTTPDYIDVYWAEPSKAEPFMPVRLLS